MNNTNIQLLVGKNSKIIGYIKGNMLYNVSGRAGINYSTPYTVMSQADYYKKTKKRKRK